MHVIRGGYKILENGGGGARTEAAQQLIIRAGKLFSPIVFGKQQVLSLLFCYKLPLAIYS